MMLLQPQQLTILTTSQCTAACAHCSMNSGPKRRDRLSFDQIKSAIEGLHAVHDLKVVIFAGGEPTILGETLLDAIAFADSIGIGTRMVTNAAWATSSAKAEAKVLELRQAGLGELNISADDFHLPFIPFDNVVRAWAAAKGKRFRAVVIANCAGPKSIVTPDYIMERLAETLPVRFDDDGGPLDLPAKSADGTLYMISNAYLQLLGRANEGISRSDVYYPADEEKLSGGCPWAARSPALSPRNHLVACCGIEAEDNPLLDFGDASISSVTELSAKADNDLIVNAIALLGPLFLKRFIASREPTIAFRERYATVCEACEDVVSRPEARAALYRHLHALAPHVACARIAQGRQAQGAE